MANVIGMDRREVSSVLALGAMLAPFLMSSAAVAANLTEKARQSKNYKVKTPDGVMVSVFEYGNPSGPPIILIHGTSQCHLSWNRQVSDAALAANFRLIAYDFRGHGDSDIILDPSLYNQGERFADELSAVMDAAKVEKPVIAAWSYGASIVGHYLTKYGSERLAGLNLVGGALSGDPKLYGPGVKLLIKSRAENFATSIEGTREFLRSCFAQQPGQEDFETMLDFNAMIPKKIKQWLLRVSTQDDVFKAVNIPVLVSHGSEDAVCLLALGQHMASVIPNAKLSVYDGAGHAFFWERPERFNLELASFIRQAKG